MKNRLKSVWCDFPAKKEKTVMAMFRRLGFRAYKIKEQDERCSAVVSRTWRTTIFHNWFRLLSLEELDVILEIKK